MTETEQKIALCEEAGWKLVEYPYAFPPKEFIDELKKAHPHLAAIGYTHLPDTNSLDVLHGMELTLDYEQWCFFIQYLGETVKNNQHLKWITPYNYVSATAAQRREALLRVFGRWKD